MGRTSLFVKPRRVNILIEESLHQEAKARAAEFEIRGGFSEYVSRLIKADRARKGRAILRQASVPVQPGTDSRKQPGHFPVKKAQDRRAA